MKPGTPQRGPNGPTYGILIANSHHVEKALALGLSIRRVAKIFGCSRGSVREFIHRKEKLYAEDR